MNKKTYVILNDYRYAIISENNRYRVNFGETVFLEIPRSGDFTWYRQGTGINYLNEKKHQIVDITEEKPKYQHNVKIQKDMDMEHNIIRIIIPEIKKS